ncbi:hypothetical protein SAMN02910289_01654 [Lachnospiraceae bacterium RM5]|nr:hypothetical protein SAMN02910289_01654 [Lachnospiraceae bacterium RM5]
MAGLKKKEQREEMLSFECNTNLLKDKRGGLTFDFIYNISAEKKFIKVTYVLKDKEMYKNGDYDQMLKLLSDSENKLVKVIFTYKGDKIEAFEIDLNSLSSVFKDDRFLKLELMGWGFISEKEHLDEYENRSSSNTENSDEIKITEA